MLIILPYTIETGIWLAVTTIIMIWATRMYLHSIYASTFGKLKDRKPSRKGKAPMVTVFLPMYNEHNVVDRLMAAVTRIDYPNYEIIVADDSTDRLTMPVLSKWKNNKRVKIIHRDQRGGFKAGALNNAIKQANSKSQYFAIFDADYVPGPDTIWKMVDDFTNKDIAAVQGYTDQTINPDKNIYTKSVSTSFSLYSLVDVSARKRLNGFIPIFGTVFMIDRSALQDVGGFNEKSITEDWDLASKLTQKGYRIFFDENIRVSGECPESFTALAKQQMRWTEGMVRDTRHNIIGMMLSSKVNLMKKIDYLFYGFGSFNCIFGTISYIISISAFLVSYRIIHAPLVDPNLILWFGWYGTFALYYAPIYLPVAIILAALVGLYREGRIENVPRSIYVLIVNSLMVPFMAYASLRGLFLEKGSWSRTPKSGESSKKS